MTAPVRTARPAIAAAALATVAALAAACGGSTPGAAPTRTVTVTAAPQAPASSGSATATGTPAAPGGPAACPTRSLGLKPGLSQGAAGSVYQVLDFTNISNVPCTLYGYPGVSLAGGHPVTQVGLAASEDPTTPRKLVTLAPGQVANALLRIVRRAELPRVQVRSGEDAVDPGLPAEPDDADLPGLQDDGLLEADEDPERQRRPAWFRRLRLATLWVDDFDS